VSGVITEITANGRQPVQGAFVAFEALMDFPAAVTFSDADGRYSMCGVPEGGTVYIGAALGRRVAYVTAASGQRTGVDITLP
jgi:hypothetical protein